MDFTLTRSRRPSPSSPPRSSADLCTPDALRAHEQPVASRRSPRRGRRWPRPTCSAWPCPSRPAAVATASSRRRWSPSRSVATSPRCPYLSTTAGGARPGRRGRPRRAPGARSPPAGAVHRRRHRRGRRLGHRVHAGSDADGGDRRPASAAFVPWAPSADAIVVATPHRRRRGRAVPRRPGAGVTVIDEDAMWGLPQGTVELAAAPATRLGGAEAVQLAVERRHRAQLRHRGRRSARGPLRITAAYVSEREQFGAQIGTFQAVGQRMADAYIDTQGVQLTAQQAAWRLAEGLPADAEGCTSPSSGPPTAATGWPTPPSTSTAASASTSTTRCTATSAGSRCSSSSSARAPSTCAGSARSSPPSRSRVAPRRRATMPLLEVRGVNVHFGGTTPCATSTSTSRPAASPGSSARTAPARPPCSTSSPACRRPPSGRVVLDGDDLTEPAAAQAGPPGHRPHVPAPRGVRLADRATRTSSPRPRSTGAGRDDKSMPEHVAEQVLDRVGIRSVADDRVDAMPTGLARLVELGRALAPAAPGAAARRAGVGPRRVPSPTSFADLLLELAGEGMAILMVEHDVPLVMKVCEWIHVLDFGAILAVGTAERDPAATSWCSTPTSARHERSRRGRGWQRVDQLERRRRRLTRRPARGPAARAARASRPRYGRIEVLHGVDLVVPEGQRRRPARAQRRRQDHDAQGRQRAR